MAALAVSEVPNIVFLTSLSGAGLEEALSHLGASQCRTARTVDEVASVQAGILVSFGTSVIVPTDILRRFRGAYNIHAASPNYPGRDPHHFAIYEQASRYGATLHVMEGRVDAGPIIDVEWFDIPSGCSPTDLLGLANEAGITLLRRWGPRLRKGEILSSKTAPISWSGKKRTRADFLAMCCLPPNIERAEFERRLFAFDAPDHQNLCVELHGHVFRIER